MQRAPVSSWVCACVLWSNAFFCQWRTPAVAKGGRLYLVFVQPGSLRTARCRQRRMTRRIHSLHTQGQYSVQCQHPRPDRTVYLIEHTIRCCTRVSTTLLLGHRRLFGHGRKNHKRVQACRGRRRQKSGARDIHLACVGGRQKRNLYRWADTADLSGRGEFY